MEKLQYDFAACSNLAAITGRAMVGVVGSGDLEVLIEPVEPNQLRVQIQIATSVDGMASVWQALLERIFGAESSPAMRIDINDFGATPGVVRLRIEQALEQLNPVQNA